MAGDGGYICLFSLFTGCSGLHGNQRAGAECPVVFVLFCFSFSFLFTFTHRSCRGEVYPLWTFWIIRSCISISCYAFPKLRVRQCWKEGGGECKGNASGSVAGPGQVQFLLTGGSGETGPTNKSAWCSQKGKAGLRELQRQAGEGSNHRRSGTTTRLLQNQIAFLLTNAGSLGTASKEMIYSQIPHFYVACVFESIQKRSREKRGKWGGLSSGRDVVRGGRDPRAMLRVRPTCTSLWVRSKIERHQGAGPSLFVRDHSTVGWIQGSSVLCLLRLRAQSGSFQY